MLRTGARWYKIRGFPREAEDLFMYLALVSYIIMSGLYFGILPTLFRLYAVAAGLVPPWATMAEDVTAMLKLIFVVQFFFWLTLWCVKWSLLFMFKKTTTGLPLYHKIWWGILAFSIVTFIICCISNFTTCSSMAKWFSAKSECATHRDNVAKRISLWFSLAVDLLTDLMSKKCPRHRATLIPTDLISYGYSSACHFDVENVMDREDQSRSHFRSWYHHHGHRHYPKCLSGPGRWHIRCQRDLGHLGKLNRLDLDAPCINMDIAVGWY